MQTVEDLVVAARLLPASDKLRLLEALWQETSPQDWPVPSKEWIAEAQRRSEEFDRGASPAATWSDVRARARREASLDE